MPCQVLIIFDKYMLLWLRHTELKIDFRFLYIIWLKILVFEKLILLCLNYYYMAPGLEINYVDFKDAISFTLDVLVC
jgi:hypothetical protein